MKRGGDRAAAGGDLPGAEQRGQDQGGEDPAPHRAPSLSAAIARSRSSRKAAEVTAWSRSGARGTGRRSRSAAILAGREESTATWSQTIERLLDVVGDEDDGARVGAKRPRQPPLHLGPGDRVERGERLVEEQHRLTGDQGAKEGDPLAHPARELSGTARLEALEAEALEQPARLAPRPGPGEAAVSERQGGVVDRREPGQQQVALRHVGAGGEALGRGLGAARQGRGRRRARAGRRSAPAGWTCRSPRGRRPRGRPAAPARGRGARSPPARRSGGRGPRGRSPCPAGSGLDLKGAPAWEPRSSSTCSLRAHYRTGSEGRRRAARGAISARLPASSPGLSGAV